MSDLISRSELLKEIEKYKFGAISNNAEREYVKTTILNLIECQPTAYDPDNVVEELEERQKEYLAGFGVHNNDEMYGVACGLGDAIKIVKHGCAYDDVCEWHCDYKFVSDKYKRETGCGYTFYDLHHAVPFKYCPYCGKKIKVVDR